MCYISNGQFNLPTTLIAGRLAPQTRGAKPGAGADKKAAGREPGMGRKAIAEEQNGGDDLLGQMLSELTW